MTRKFETGGFSAVWKRAALAALALGVTISMSGLPARAQNEQPPPQPPLQADPAYGDPQQQQQQGAPPPSDGGPQSYPGGPQGGPQAGPPAGPQGYPAGPQRGAQGGPQYPRAEMPPVPRSLTIPAGTIIPVRIQQWLSSDRNHAGDGFNANLAQPLIANGWVVAQRGQPIVGQVAVAEKAGHGKSDSHLGLALTSLTLVNGQQIAINSELVQMAAGGPTDGQKTGAVAATTIIGAAIGGVAGGGAGAAIGAGVGAGAGIAGVMATRGRPTVVGPETLLSFRLLEPAQVSTEGSEVAFRPYSPRDYGRDQDAYAGARPGYPAQGPYPYAAYGAPCGPYYGCYPYYPYPYGPVVGFGFGFGHRFGYYRGFRRW